MKDRKNQEEMDIVPTDFEKIIESELSQFNIKSCFGDLFNHIHKVSECVKNENSPIMKSIREYQKYSGDLNEVSERIKIIKADEITANRRYDAFVRQFSDIVENSGFGEKQFYAIPLVEECNDDSIWDNLWCNTIKEALDENNRANIRLYLSRNLFNSPFTLPQGMYFYKLNEEKIKGVSDGITKSARELASNMVLMFRLLKETSDKIRNALVETIDYDNELISDTIIIPKDLEKDEETALALVNCETIGEHELREFESLIRRYASENSEIKRFINVGSNSNQKELNDKIKEVYQKLLKKQEDLKALDKLVYNKSISGLYKLYDIVTKNHNDFVEKKLNLDGINTNDFDYCDNIIEMTSKILKAVETYLYESFCIKPLEIIVGSDYNKLDVDWFEVLAPEDAPNEELKERVASIVEPGFAKYDDKGCIDHIVKPAKITVYNNTVRNLAAVFPDTIDEDNKDEQAG